MPPRRLGGKRVLLAMLIVLAAAVIPAVFVPTLVCKGGDPELPDIGSVPPFALVDERGETFTQEALRGHPTLINFVFTRCGTICPGIAMVTERLQERTSDRKGIDIKFVTISLDPEYDTPARLAEFAERYKADPTRWRFLTGPADRVRAFVTGPLMTAMDIPPDQPTQQWGGPNIVHRGYFLLVDADLVIRGVYESNDSAKLDELIRHARYLARISGDRGYKFGGG